MLTELPFIVLGPLALIVTEDCLSWIELTTELLYAIAGAETTGTAGEIEGLPFAGRTAPDFP